MRGTLNYTTLWRSGGQIPTVSPDQLNKFSARKYNPQLKDLRLDTSGMTTQDLKQSLWNKAVIIELVHATKNIIANTKDRRFGLKDFNLKKLYRDRFQKLYQEIHAWWPFPNETEEERGLRLSLRLIKRRQGNKRINIIHLVSHSKANYFIRL